jgi:hypothetical protein
MPDFCALAAAVGCDSERFKAVGYDGVEGYADDDVVRGAMICSSGREGLLGFVLCECAILKGAELKGREDGADGATAVCIGVVPYGCEREGIC